MKKITLLLIIALSSVFLVFTGCEADFAEEKIQSDSPMLDAADQLRYNGNQGEAVLLVHGNWPGSPSDFNDTISYLRSHGWPSSKIVTVNWRPSSNPANNDHCGSELNYVKSALSTAMSKSSTGKIDVIGHSLGATLAAKAIIDKGWGKNQIRTFIGISGAFRGLNSCTYTSYLKTCSKTCGLHYKSSVLKAIKNKGRFAQKQYAMYSYADEVACNCGYGYNVYCCYIYGTHTGRPYTVDSTYTKSTYPYGHWGMLKYTESKQADWLDNY